MRTIRASERRVTSALTFAEANRVIVRARVAGHLTTADERDAVRALQTFERRCTVIIVSESVLGRAGHPFPVEPVRTLDAIHLATAGLLGGPPQLVTILTRDARIRENAAALGFGVA
jgi:predicted nucleic acid-binding protein